MRITIWHTDDVPDGPGGVSRLLPGAWATRSPGWSRPRATRRGIVERREGGVRHFEVRRAADSRLPRPLRAGRHPLAQAGRLPAQGTAHGAAGARAARRPAGARPRHRGPAGAVGGPASPGALRLPARPPPLRGPPRGPGPRRAGRAARAAVDALWIRLRRIVLRGADLVLPISTALAEILRDREGVDPRRMVVFPVGVSRATLRARRERCGGSAGRGAARIARRLLRRQPGDAARSRPDLPDLRRRSAGACPRAASSSSAC